MADLTVEHAIELCELHLAQHPPRAWDPRTWQCGGCVRFSSDARSRCFAAKTGNRGCPFVNGLADREHRARA